MILYDLNVSINFSKQDYNNIAIYKTKPPKCFFCFGTAITVSASEMLKLYSSLLSRTLLISTPASISVWILFRVALGDVFKEILCIQSSPTVCEMFDINCLFYWFLSCYITWQFPWAVSDFLSLDELRGGEVREGGGIKRPLTAILSGSPRTHHINLLQSNVAEERIPRVWRFTLKAHAPLSLQFSICK